MYLTQMRLDMNNHRTLSAISAPNKLHGALESSFPGERQRNLWRIDSRGGQNYLLILSSEKPDLSRMAVQFAPPGETWQTKDYTPLLDRICQGSRWQFCLCANPTYSVPAGPGQRGPGVCAQHSSKSDRVAKTTKQEIWIYPVGRRIRHNKIGLVSLQKGKQREKCYLFGGDL